MQLGCDRGHGRILYPVMCVYLWLWMLRVLTETRTEERGHTARRTSAGHLPARLTGKQIKEGWLRLCLDAAPVYFNCINIVSANIESECDLTGCSPLDLMFTEIEE